MPRKSFTAGADRERTSVDRFPSFKLEAGELNRLYVPNEEWAWAEFTHTIVGPVFLDSGKPVMETKQGRNGSSEVIKTDFIGRPICLGAEETIRAKEFDVEQCPVCSKVVEMIEAGIADAREMRPKLRFALPVIKYDTVSRSSDRLRNPPNAQVLIWAMTPWTHDKLDDIRGQIADLLEVEGGAKAVKLQMADIVVGTESTFQKVDKIYPLRPAKKHDVVAAMLKALWDSEENRPTDEQLQAACGRKPDRDFMRRDIEDAEFRWRKAVGLDKQAGDGPVAGGQDLGGELDSILGEPETPPPPVGGDPLDEFRTPDQKQAQDAASAAPEEDDIFGGGSSGSAPADPGDLLGEPEAVTAGVGAGSNGAGKIQSFGDILGD